MMVIITDSYMHQAASRSYGLNRMEDIEKMSFSHTISLIEIWVFRLKYH